MKERGQLRAKGPRRPVCQAHGAPIHRHSSGRWVDGTPDAQAGERVSVFSYGSGCCSEFYSGRLGADARTAAAAADLQAKLDERRLASVEEYESVERQRSAWIDCGDYDVPVDTLGDWYDRFYSGRKRLIFRGMSDFYRQYAWS